MMMRFVNQQVLVGATRGDVRHECRTVLFLAQQVITYLHKISRYVVECISEQADVLRKKRHIDAADPKASSKDELDEPAH